MENLVVQVSNEWKNASVGVPGFIIDRLQITESELIVAFGTFRCKVKCVRGNSRGRALRLSGLLARNMGLASGDRIKVKYKKGLLIIGPLVGIFVEGGVAKVQPFGEQTRFLREMAELCQGHHYMFYVFTTKDVMWEQRRIRGLVPEMSQGGEIGWKRRTMPFPQVFYDRFISYKLKHTDLLLKRKFLHQPIPYFNGVIGDKGLMHEKYVTRPELLPYLPHTTEYRHNLLESWLNRNKVVYIKPRLGTQGKGIIRVTQTKEGYHACCVSKGGETAEYRTSSVGALKLKIMTWLKGAKCIIQQGIKLATVGGRTADYRVLAQRGLNGSWQITGMVARLGKKGSVINNLHGGGDVLDVKVALGSFFESETNVQSIIEEMEKVTKLVCRASERDKRFLGELGVDLGVDTSGRVWVIEANPKPGRGVFTRLKAYDLRKRAVIQPIHYAAFIAGFGIPQFGKGEDCNETV